MAAPEACPLIVRFAEMRSTADAWIGSAPTPTMTSVPRADNPGISSLVAFEFGTVARMVLAPPSFVSSAAAFCAAASM